MFLFRKSSRRTTTGRDRRRVAVPGAKPGTAGFDRQGLRADWRYVRDGAIGILAQAQCDGRWCARATLLAFVPGPFMTFGGAYTSNRCENLTILVPGIARPGGKWKPLLEKTSALAGEFHYPVADGSEGADAVSICRPLSMFELFHNMFPC